MRVKSYQVFSRCLDESILAGLRKAEKREHLKLLNEDEAAEMVRQYIMNEVFEYFDWDEELPGW